MTLRAYAMSQSDFPRLYERFDILREAAKGRPTDETTSGE